MSYLEFLQVGRKHKKKRKPRNFRENFLSQRVSNKSASIRRLLRMLFGATTEKTEKTKAHQKKRIILKLEKVMAANLLKIIPEQRKSETLISDLSGIYPSQGAQGDIIHNDDATMKGFVLDEGK